MGISDDQFRLPLAPSSVGFAASKVAQADTRPGLSAGFDTAMPLEHCAAGAGVGVGIGVSVGAGIDVGVGVADGVGVWSGVVVAMAMVVGEIAYWGRGAMVSGGAAARFSLASAFAPGAFAGEAGEPGASDDRLSAHPCKSRTHSVSAAMASRQARLIIFADMPYLRASGGWGLANALIVSHRNLFYRRKPSSAGVSGH